MNHATLTQLTAVQERNIPRTLLVCVLRVVIVVATMIVTESDIALAQVPQRGGGLNQASYSVDHRPTDQSRQAVTSSAAPASSSTAPGAGRRITPQGESSSQNRNRSTSPFGSFVALLIVVGIIGLAYRFLKKGGAGLSTGLPVEAVEVLGQSVLAHRQAIQIVRVGSRVLVLGSSADGLNTLSEITDPNEVEALAVACKSDKPAHRMKSVVDIFAPRRSTAKPVRRKPVGRSGMEDLHA